ncbi:MFS transporter [Paenibacillus ferrarius]|uniref:MFS transporter n=1 Tax=Paenibacillus ferrarius TaxID=1469647 RepID=UPI003D2CB967
MFTNPYVRTIFVSRVFLQLGIWIRNLAVLLYVTDLTHNDSFYVSLISVLEYAPIFIFALLGGTLADRWRPKRTMVWSDAISAASVLAVWAALALGSWYALLFGTFLSASLSQFSQPSALKLYKKHVPAEHFQSVMALSQSLVAVFMVVGPLVGTFIFIQAGIHLSLALTFVFFLLSALTLATLPRDVLESQTAARGTLFAEMKAGVRYIAATRALRVLSAAFAAAGLAAGLIQPLLIFIVMEKLGMEKSFIQWTLMINGAAMLIGGMAIMGIAKKIKPQVLLTIGLLVSAVCTVIVGASTSVVLSLAMQVISGLFYPCIQIGIQSMIMRNTEAAFIGRVGGAITPIFMGMMVIGMLLGSYVKEATSLFTVYAVSGGLLAVGAMLLLPLLTGSGKRVLEQGDPPAASSR